MFLLVGATFMTAAYVQSQRGHIGIEAFVGLLPPPANRVRLWLVDVASLLFCAFFAWKSWTLAYEAWVEGQVSNSMWSPPLAIPYVPDGLRHDAAVLADPAAARHSPDRSHAPMSVLGIGVCYGRRDPVCDVLGHAHCLCVGRGRGRLHGHLHARRLARYGDAERLRGNGLDHPSVDPALHPQGRRDRPSRAPARISIRRCMSGYTAIPGGLGVANVFACALFAAMAGSSPATCSAIGSAGIPEMRKRGYSGGLAAGIIAAGGTLGILLPPSITMILFAVAAEKSLGRLFLAGIGPGLLLVTLFGFYAVLRFRKEYAAASCALREDRGGRRDPAPRRIHAG